MLSSYFTQSATPGTAKIEKSLGYDATASAPESHSQKSEKSEKKKSQINKPFLSTVPGLKLTMPRLAVGGYKGPVTELNRFVSSSTGVDFVGSELTAAQGQSVKSFFGAIGLRAVEVSMHLSATGLLVSSVGGVINTTLAFSSIWGASAGYASLLALFDQFRVVGISLKAEPYNKYSKTTTISGPIVMVFDCDDSTALGGYDTNLQNARRSNTDDLFPVEAWYPRPGSNSVDSLWMDTQSPFTLAGAAKAYASALSASYTYGMVFYKTVVAYRLLAP